MQWTLFTIPRAFEGVYAARQIQALASWAALEPRPDVVLLGDEEGTAEAAGWFGYRHIACVEKSLWGTPLVSSAFKLMQEYYDATEVLCYVNADLILHQDFATALVRVALRFKDFLMVGRRWDVEGAYKPAWGLIEGVSLHPSTGMDYFAFRRGLYNPDEMPPLAVGRRGWDNWLLLDAIARGAETVDATKVATAIHLAHPAGKRNEEEVAQNVRWCVKKQQELRMAGIVSNTRWVLDSDGVRLRGKGEGR
jgi:hypothetical protein